MECLKKSLLSIKWTPLQNQVRFGRRVNIQRPRIPHFEKARLLTICTPKFPKNFNKKPSPDYIPICGNTMPVNYKQIDIQPDHPYAILLSQDIRKNFENSQNIFIFHQNVTPSDDWFNYQLLLHKSNMSLKVYGKKLLKYALDDTKYKSLLPLFEFSNAIIFSPINNVKLIMKMLKKMPTLVLLAGVVEGEYLSSTQIEEYSKLPDLPMARAQLCNILTLAPGQLVQHLNHHQSNIVQGLERLANPPKDN